MRAAVVSAFDTAPRYEEFPTPVPTRPTELVVEVLAAGLHPRVRSQANGSHYTSTDALPLVPGIDGVGRGDDGVLRYFLLPDTTLGSMAERTLIDTRRSIELPEGTEPLAIAAAMNPAMSSWVALRRRIAFEPGKSVLVLGATGSAGRLAVQIARHFGASRVVGAGRDADRLASLDADAVVSLAGDDADVAHALAREAADVDVVIDYLWGATAASALRAIIPARTDEGQPLTWLQIGAITGTTSPIPSEALRAARLQIVGSGQGSVDTRDFLAELPGIARAISDGTLDVRTRSVALADVEAAWAEPMDGSERLVVVP